MPLAAFATYVIDARAQVWGGEVAAAAMPLMPGGNPRYDAIVKLSTLNTAVGTRAEAVPPITGVFGWLPTELVEAVCAAVLRMDSSWFNAFTRTCKGVRRSVGRTTVVEFLVRRCSYMLPGPALLDKACSYTEHMKLKMRNRVDLNALSDLLDQGATHCARPGQACCSELRREFNNTNAVCSPKGRAPDPDTLLFDAMGGRTLLRVDVAAPAETHLLCATPGGVVLHEGNDVRVVKAQRAEVFAPGRELASLHLATVKPDLARNYGPWAAAEGDRVVVCTRHDSDAAMYKLQLWGAHGRDRIGEHALGRRLDDVALAGLRRIWMRNGVVWLLLTCVIDDRKEVLQFVRVVIGKPSKEFIRCVVLGHISSVCVAKASGHVALLEIGRREADDGQTERVIFFDPDRVVLHRITEAFDLSEYAGEPNVLAISPNGRVIVLLLRDKGEDGQTRSSPEIVIYQREGDVSTWRVQVSQQVACLHARGPSWWGWRALRDLPVDDLVFSPSGDTLLIAFDNEESPFGITENCGLVALNVEEALRTGQVQGCGIVQYMPLSPRLMPGQLVWSDGLFLRTPEGGGVLRVGLVAA